jgi:hypothetical protein
VKDLGRVERSDRSSDFGREADHALSGL